ARLALQRRAVALAEHPCLPQPAGQLRCGPRDAAGLRPQRAQRQPHALANVPGDSGARAEASCGISFRRMADDLKTRSIRGLVWAVGESAGVAVISLASFIVLARLLEPQDFGIVA